MKTFLRQLELGQLATNTYIMGDAETGRVFIIDPAAEPERIEETLERDGLRPEVLLLTHAHYDHIGAADALRDRYRIPLWCGKDDAPMLKSPGSNLSVYFGEPVALEADRLYEDGQEFRTPCGKMEVIATPGHTAGSVCLYFPERAILFSGDTLFKGSVGRTDFPTGDSRQLLASLRNVILKLPPETRVFPGHGEETTIEYEKKHNPYARS